MNASIAVIMPTFNKARYLDLSLASWTRQQQDDYQLLVVDDGSTDATADILEKYRSELPIRPVRVPHRGRAAARNHGLRMAQSGRILFVDDDRVVPPGFLQAHREYRASDEVVIGWQHGLLVDWKNHGDQFIGPEKVVSFLEERPGRLADVLDGRGGETITAEDLREERFQLDTLRLEDPWEAYLERMIRAYGEDLSDCPLAWACGTTGNLSVSRELLRETEGFDEGFTGWGLEDTELHYRLVKAGARTRVAREAVNYHQNHPKDVGLRRADWGRNANWFLRKHETLDVALYIHAETGNLPHLEACQIASEALRLGGNCPAVKLLRRLTINSAFDIVSHLEALCGR